MKRRNVFSPYDRLLLLALAVGILLVCVRYRTLSDSPLTSDGEQAAVSYLVRTDSSARANTLALTETIYFADTNDLLGCIDTAPSISAANTESVRADGTVAYLPSGNAYELRGVFLADGSFTENGFFANGRRHITANQTIPALMNGLNVTILVLNISHFSSK